jgi:hypothetical protein
MKQQKVIKITNDVKLNYIRHFICRNLKKINYITKIEEFEIESSDSEDEFIIFSELEYD